MQGVDVVLKCLDLGLPGRNSLSDLFHTQNCNDDLCTVSTDVTSTSVTGPLPTLGRPLLGTRATQDTGHRVVPLVTGVLEDRVLALVQQ